MRTTTRLRNCILEDSLVKNNFIVNYNSAHKSFIISTSLFIVRSIVKQIYINGCVFSAVSFCTLLKILMKISYEFHFVGYICLGLIGGRWAACLCVAGVSKLAIFFDYSRPYFAPGEFNISWVCVAEMAAHGAAIGRPFIIAPLITDNYSVTLTYVHITRRYNTIIKTLYWL